MPLWVRFETWAVDDREIGREICKLALFWAAQKVADEKTVPRKLCHDAHIQTMGWVGAPKKVVHIICAATHVRDHVIIKLIELRRFHRRVVFPPNRVLNTWRPNNELVLGGATSVFAGCDKECATVSVDTFTVFNGGFLQLRFGQVIIDVAKPLDALILKFHLRVDRSMVHCRVPYAAVRKTSVYRCISTAKLNANPLISFVSATICVLAQPSGALFLG